MRIGSNSSTLTSASASLVKVAAPAPGTFSILTVIAGRSWYSMPARSSTRWAADSSSAMNATTPLAPCVVAHKSRLTPLPAITSHSRAIPPGWFSSSTVKAPICAPSWHLGQGSPLIRVYPLSGDRQSRACRSRARSAAMSRPSSTFASLATRAAPIRNVLIKRWEHGREFLEAVQVVSGQQQIDVRGRDHHAKCARPERYIVALVRVHPDNAVTEPGQPFHRGGEYCGVAPV